MTQNGWAQRGYKIIEKAKNKIEAKDYIKALSLLDKAEKMNYGFCGNAWLEADYEIDSLRFVAFHHLNRYDLARRSLDSILSFGKREDLDSLKVLTYQNEYGSKFLKDLIDDSIPNSFVDCTDYHCFGNIPIEESSKILRFKIYGDYLKYMFEEDKIKRNSLWIREFLSSNAYNMIKFGG